MSAQPVFDWKDILTGRIRDKLTHYSVGTSAMDNWALWTRTSRGGPAFSLTRIYDFAKSSEWGAHDDKGLTDEEIAVLKRSEPLREVGRDPGQHDINKREAWLLDTMLHRAQTPAIWRGVAFSFLGRGPEYDMPLLAAMYLRRLNPTRARQPVSDDAYVEALESLLEFTELMLDG